MIDRALDVAALLNDLSEATVALQQRRDLGRASERNARAAVRKLGSKAQKKQHVSQPLLAQQHDALAVEPRRQDHRRARSISFAEVLPAFAPFTDGKQEVRKRSE